MTTKKKNLKRMRTEIFALCVDTHAAHHIICIEKKDIRKIRRINAACKAVSMRQGTASRDRKTEK